MDAVNEAMKALKQVALKGKKDKGLAERVDSLTATLRLLDISLSADSQIFDKLVLAVRKPFIPLYEKFPLQAFKLSAAIFSFLFHEKIVMQLTAGNRLLQSSWEDVAESLLSGVLDFLETHSDSTTLRTLASALYPVLCRICFSTVFCSSITMGSTLRYTAFSLLVDSADEPANKEMLRDPEYLGSRRLGATLYGSKDYVILENLLLLVLIVAPKFEFMDKRSAFMREVFVTNYHEDTTCGESLARVLTKPTERDPDLLQAQAIDVLAQSNLMFPQPFEVIQIDSCGLRFPQKPPQQRLIVDYKSLLANVLKDEGYESFRASFDQICGLSFSTVDKKSLIKVVVQTSSAPNIQSQALKVPDGQSPSVTFEIRESDLFRFKHALRSRGITGAPHISVSQEGPRLEFDREGNRIPEIFESVRKVQTIERVMQLSQRSDDSPKDRDAQNREDCLPVTESPGSPLVRSSRTLVGVPQEVTATTSSGFLPVPSKVFPNLLVSHKTQTVAKTATTLSNVKLVDTTPRPRVPRRQSVFVPATPSQNKILRKDVFGSGDTDLSELSDDSEADSMKALSQKLAARTDSMIAITKRASILADAVSSAGASTKKVLKRRVLDSDDEEVLSSSRKGAKGISKPGTANIKKAVPAAVVSDVEDCIPPAPAPLKKGRPKPTKKNPGPPDEKHKPLARDNHTPKRKREAKGDDFEAGGVSDVQDKPPPVKRARKTAGGKLGATKPKAAPPRDSQVLRKARPAAKKNANYGGRAKAARASPTRNSAVLSDGEFTDTLDLETRPVDPRVDPPLVDDRDDIYASSPPAPPKSKSKSKSKVAAKPRSTLTEKIVSPEKPKTTAMETKAKTQIGARTRAAAATKAKGADEEKIAKAGPPQEAKRKAKRKPEVVSAGEWEGGEGEEERGRAELAKDSPAVIEVSSSSSPSEPPKAIPSKRKPVSRVTSQEERVADDLPKSDNQTKALPAPKRVAVPQDLGDSRIEKVAAEQVEVIAAPNISTVRSTSTEKRAMMPPKPISEQAFITSVERKQDDRASESAEVERPPVAESRATNDSRLAEAGPPAGVSGGVVNEVEAEIDVEEAMTTGAQGSHDMDVEFGRSDPVATMSPLKIPTGGITEAPPMHIRELTVAEESRPLEMNPDDGESSEGGIHGFTLSQPITDRMSVDIPTPQERLGTMVGMKANAQSTPPTLPRGQQQAGYVTFRKPKVTFATTPSKGKDAVHYVQDEITPRGGAQRRTIFEGDVFGTNSAWRRMPAASSGEHSALTEVLNEIQGVIVKKITHQFEVAEEEARFARNDVHNEALSDFKKMHSQRAVQFNALVDLETAYATRERELLVAYEATLAVNAEILGHVRQRIMEHDEKNLVGRLPKTLRKSPISALMNSYLK